MKKQFRPSTLKTAPANSSRTAFGPYTRVNHRDGLRVYELSPDVWTPAHIKAFLDDIECAKPLVAKMKKNPKKEDAWYQASYKVFKKKGNPRKLQDFICVIGFAYSWLPNKSKLAACPSESQFQALKRAVASCRRNSRNRLELIEAAQAAVGLSQVPAVTVSKVLHFWSPALAPMYDIKVMRVLRQLSVTSHINWEKPSNHAMNYLRWWSLADKLIAASKTHRIGKLNYRALDELMFQFNPPV